MNDIGSRIKQRREELGLSQEELAMMVGYKSRSSINKIESDGRGLPQSKIVLLADALKMSPACLLGWDDDSSADAVDDSMNELLESLNDRGIGIGSRIKQRRKELGLTQDELADMIGCKTGSSVSLLEHGRSDLPRKKIALLADALKMSPACLLGWDDDSSSKAGATDDSLNKSLESMNDLGIGIGSRIKQRRESLGLSVDELAEKVDKSRATIYRYENGDIEELPATIIKPLAEALTTSPNYLMGWDDDSSSNADAVDDSMNELLESLNDLGQKKILGYITDICRIANYQKDFLSFVHASLGSLNETGQKKVLDYMTDICRIDKYQDEQ